MGSEWKKTALGKAFEVNPSRPLKRNKVTPFVPMDVLPVNARAIDRIESREYTGSGMRFQNGDTLIARITPCLENGKTAFVSGLRNGEVAHGSTEYIVLSGIPEKSDPLFGYYLSRSPVFRSYAIGHMEGTSGRQRVPASAVENFPLLLPPIEEQRAIAHILGTLDDKIELNRQQNKTLEDMARALFKAWFVDFEPVRAKMEGRWQRGQSLPGLPADIFDLFPDRLVESELGEIPEGWTYALSGEIYDVGIGKTPPRKESQWFSEGGINVPWLSIRDMGNCGVFAYETAESITREAVAKFNVRWIPAGTVLLSFKLTVGRIVIAECEMTSNEAIAHFKGKENSPSVNFLYCYLKSYDFSKLGSTSSIATATNSKAIRNLPIISPSKEVVNAFDSVASCLFESIKTNSQQSRTLAQLRDTLLPKLISGEVRVPSHFLKETK